VRVRVRVALLIAALAILTGDCSVTTRVPKISGPPPVDIRAVPGGVEVTLTCGPGAPLYSELDEVDAANHLQHVVAHTDYPKSSPTRTLVLPVPLAARSKHLLGTVAIKPGYPPRHTLPLYVFNFQYNSLPRRTVKHISGEGC
jgi:hypothetical protein